MANETKIVISAVTAQAEAAMRTLGQSVSGLTGKMFDLSGTAATLTGALSVTAFAAYIKSSIDAQDEIYNLSQKTGTAVETLAGLKYAADQNDTSLSAVADAAKKLSSSLVDKPEIFAKIGVTSKDTTGALVQMADIFAAMPDGVEKSALAVKLMGKSGEEMIPMLNNGSAAMAKLIEEGKQYNPITKESAAQAAEFNDNLAALKSSAGTFGISLAKDLLPPLTEITTAMKDAYKEGGLLKALWIGFGGASTAIFTDDMVARERQIAKELKSLREEQSKNLNRKGWMPDWLNGLHKNDSKINEANEKMLTLEKELLDIQTKREELAKKSGKKPNNPPNLEDPKKNELAKGKSTVANLLKDFDKEISAKSFTLNSAMMSAADRERAASIESVTQRTMQAQMIIKDLVVTEQERLVLSQSVTLAQEEQIQMLEKLHAQLEKNNRSWEYGARIAMRNYMDEASNTAKQSEMLFTTAFKAMEGALVSFVKTGKLDFTSLADTIVSELIRIQVQKMLAGLAGSLFGGTGGVPPASDTNYKLTGDSGQSYFGLKMGKPHASGGSVNAGTLYPVNELGPELLSQGGQDYLMMGGKGGFVKPLGSKASVSGGQSVSVAVNVVNQSGQQLAAKQSGPAQFNGRDWVVGIVLEAADSDPAFRGAFGLGRG